MKRILAVLLTLAMAAACACAGAEGAETFRPAAEAAIAAMEGELRAMQETVYVYREYGDTLNNYTQKAKMGGFALDLIEDMDENWAGNPHGGESCIRCAQTVRADDWGGWLFLNGYLPEGETAAKLNDGSMDGQGLNLAGARELRFWARGEEGGEKVEFFTCGFGYPGSSDIPNVAFPDSSAKQTTGYIELTQDWQEYAIDLSGADMSYIVCGFGFVMSDLYSDRGKAAFCLDDIRFIGDFSRRPDAHYLLRSYETDSIYIKNAAYTYDNALAALAFISAGKQEEAAEILDAFVYAVENDRYRPGRIRNAYAAGNITSLPGWDGAARLPGWYDKEEKSWYEDRYQTGCNPGNTAYAALALLQYDAAWENERYLNTAAAIMDWVIDECTDGTPGFTGGYDGWPEAGADTTYVYTYKSIEHNIDCYAAFTRLYQRTGEQRYADAAQSAFELIRSMYDGEKGIFYTGTGNDGFTPSTDNIVLDAQVWACLALGSEFAPYEGSLKTVAEMETEEGGYPFSLANINGGWWAEGTAYTALMYLLRGETETAERAFRALEGIQLESGKFPAATVDNLSTGIDLFDGSPWYYGTAPHLAPTAWFVMAVNGFNPYAFD